MTVGTLQVLILLLVAAGATAVALIRVPVRQVIALSAYGLLLALMFLVLQAPDVTLSELAIGAVVLPLLLLLTLAKVRKREK
jgi:energy-converting hydrogenase B subunit D